MKEKNRLQMELEDLIDKRSLQELYIFMENHIIEFFSTPDISKYYKTLKNVDYSQTKKLTPKIMLAWMAFLSGDHGNLFLIIRDINEMDLKGPEESSLFYSLKAMIGYMMNPTEGLRYAKLSIDILSQEKTSFYMGNAKLTYGQMLANTNQYRLASEMFSASYGIFQRLNHHFLALIAMINELLNRYKLGEFEFVVDKCKEELFMASSYTEEMKTYVNAIHLPLGMCYYEMNRSHLAIKHLALAKDSIDQLGLFHMHGLIELYLFKAYCVTSDTLAMEQLKNEMILTFEKMNYRQTDLLISMFKIFTAEKGGLQLIEADIEKFELEFEKSGIDSHSIIIESLVYLKLMGFSHIIRIEDIEKRLENLKYIGMIPHIQMTMLQLAELYYLEKNKKMAVYYLKEALQIYKDYGICGCFCALPLHTTAILKETDERFYSILHKNLKGIDIVKVDSMLTAREKEIMNLIAVGKTNEEISKILFISIGTIKWHINHIFGKLEVKNRVQAIEKAKKLGEIT
ncbi:response regulator transcription factor [Anaerosolibacter sp.]|uniref:response regulator transcription factor n=1 Tax=Anaerosolibacter sp. TaxID=1872527 RepID=UPI0039EE552C